MRPAPRWLARAGICVQLLAALGLVLARLAGVAFPWQVQLVLACALFVQTALMYSGPSRRRPHPGDTAPLPRVVTLDRWPAG